MRSAAIIVLFLSSASLIQADTLQVPGDYPSIQQAIAAAQDGDAIQVAPGTYVENINFLGRAIILESMEGPETTWIDGNQQGSTVLFENAEGRDSVLRGFTITNGSGLQDPSSGNDSYFGGGICCWMYTSPTLEKNIVAGNVLTGMHACFGAGICCLARSSPLVSENIVRDNSITYGGFGGGISCCGGDEAVISGNRIINNDAGNSYSMGGGFYSQCTISRITVENNTIRDNIAGSGGGMASYWDPPASIYRNNHVINNRAKGSTGGGIYCDYLTEVEIRGNLVCDNHSDFNGGGISLKNDSLPFLINNIICNNTSMSKGGGINCNSAMPTLFNNTLYGNQAVKGGGGIHGGNQTLLYIRNSILWNNSSNPGPQIMIESSTDLNIDYSDLQGGMAGISVEAGSHLDWGLNMINSSPGFIDALKGDFHISYNSPCKDAGGGMLIPEDFEGDPRTADGMTDLGADEFHPHLYPMGTVSPGGAMSLTFVGTPGSTQVALIVGGAVLDPPLPCDYGDWYMDFPTVIYGGLGSISAEGYLTLSGHVPAVPAGPYTVYLQAAVDYKLTNLCTLKVE